jgi:hypothetical protein
MSTYQAGYLSVANGSNAVTGIGTYWLTYAHAGDTINLGGVNYIIGNITDNHTLTLTTNYTGTTLVQAQYLITFAVPPGQFYKFQASTSSWVEFVPAPTINSVTVAPLLKANLLSWIIVDAIWGTGWYQTEIWHNTINDFTSATLLATVDGDTYRHTDLSVQAHYYWLRAVSATPAVTGVKTAATQTPAAVQTSDIAAGAVSINEFGFTNTAVTGAGGSSYVGVFSITITNSSSNDLPFVITHACLQQYSGSAVATKWLLYDSTISQAICDWGTFNDKVPLPSLTAVYVIPAGATRAIILYWYGADSTVSITNRSIQLLALKV